ncbi:MAG TPA: DUF456 domain-containing protein [Anaerolineaceae bacterium]
MDWGLFTLQVIILTVMLLGFLGVVSTLIPGLFIIWAAALVYGLIDGFNWGSGILFAVITILMIVGNLIDNVIMGVTAHQKGASWISILVAFVALFVGSLIRPPWTGPVFALVGLFVSELVRHRNWRNALEAAKSLVMGCGFSALVRGGIALLMIGLWIAWTIYA